MRQEHATIKEIVEFGLDKIPSEQTITVNLRDFMYIRRTLKEYVRFFHQPLHYPKIENINDFLGSISSGGGFEILSTATYKKLYTMKLPENIKEMDDDSVFEHPLFPKYYEPTEE